MYQGLAPYFDEIFTVTAAEIEFLTKRMEGIRYLLDIGCGTGSNTILFSAPTREIIGIDLNEEMIEYALRHHRAPGVHFEVLDMTRITEKFHPHAFDGLLCLGNTLVHLTQKDVLAQFLSDMRSLLLMPLGIGIIQILNYNRILDENIRSLPVIETPNLRFTRTYETDGDLLQFHTYLEIKKTGAIIANTTPLLPLRTHELKEFLLNAGFTSVDFFGSFSGAPLTSDSPLAIAIVR